MSWLVSLLVSVLTGVAALLAAGLVAAAYAEWYQVSTREGAAGYVVVGVALLGGLAGGVAGLSVARLLAEAGFWKASAVALGLVFGVAAVLALIFYYFADIPPKLGEDDLRLDVEIRLPVGASKPEGEGSFTLGSVIAKRQRASQAGELLLDRARLEGGRWIVPARVYLFTTRGQRSILAEVGGKRIAAFLLPLPAHPGTAQEPWSEWGPRPLEGSPPWPDSEASYRYRVQRLSHSFVEEERVREEAEAQARFDALAQDTPLAQLLPCTAYGQSEKRRGLALQRIAARPDLVGELAVLMRHADARLAVGALGLVQQLPNRPPELISALQAAGEDLLTRIRSVNAAAAGHPDVAVLATDVSRRYQAWNSALHSATPKPEVSFSALLRDIAVTSAAGSENAVLLKTLHDDAERWLLIWAQAKARDETSAAK